MHVGKSSHTDRQNYDVIAKDSERSKIPIDYEHNQTGLHEITICDGRSKVEKTIQGDDSFPRLKEVQSGRELLFPLNWKWK